MSSNEYEERARAVKAYAIVNMIDTIQSQGTTDLRVGDLSLWESVSNMPQSTRDTIALLAGVHSPSEQTWGVVVAILRSVEERMDEQ